MVEVIDYYDSNSFEDIKEGMFLNVVGRKEYVSKKEGSYFTTAYNRDGQWFGALYQKAKGGTCQTKTSDIKITDNKKINELEDIFLQLEEND